MRPPRTHHRVLAHTPSPQRTRPLPRPSTKHSNDVGGGGAAELKKEEANAFPYLYVGLGVPPEVDNIGGGRRGRSSLRTNKCAET